MMAQRSSVVMQNLVEIERREWSVIFLTFFVNHVSRLTLPVSQSRYSREDSFGICRPI